MIFLNSILIFNKWKDCNKYRVSNAQKKNDYTSKKFAIIRRLECPNCGIFSFFIVNLGCVNYYLSLGYIPIIDLQTFPNMYNGGNISIYNPWELYFYQVYNYTLEEVNKYSANITYFNCTANIYRPNSYIYNEETGQWEYNIYTTINGHGELSVILAQQFIQLTEEEVLCIRWHMGAYDDEKNWYILGHAIEKYPNVLYTHTADMIASRVNGI